MTYPDKPDERLLAHFSESEVLDCPYCPNQGWYEDVDRHTGEPIQIQCEFCETEPFSKFNFKTYTGRKV